MSFYGSVEAGNKAQQSLFYLFQLLEAVKKLCARQVCFCFPGFAFDFVALCS